MVDHNRVAEERFEASQRAADRLLKRLGTQIEHLDRWVTEGMQDTQYVTEVRLKVRYDTLGDVLAILKCDGEAGKLIAFGSGDTMSEALMTLTNRVNNGTIKWREDRPYGEGNSNGG